MDTSILSVQEVKDYLGIDYTDASVERNIERLIKTADAYLKSAISKDYPKDDPKAKELALIVVSDLYDNRGLNEKVSPTIRKLVQDFILQLQIESIKDASEDGI